VNLVADVFVAKTGEHVRKNGYVSWYLYLYAYRPIPDAIMVVAAAGSGDDRLLCFN